MLIATGKAKGHRLRQPIIADLNPTLSWSRKQIFSLIKKHTNFQFKDKVGLDLFAGSGALGLEALSLEAKRVDFVDKHPEAVKTIRHNLNHTHFLGKGTVHQKDVMEFLDDCGQKYDFIFIDPDSKYANITRVVQQTGNRLNPAGILVLRLIKPFTGSFYALKIVFQGKLPCGFLFLLKQ